MAGGPVAGLAVGTVVALIFHAGQSGSRRHVLPARVVHTAPSGAGLRFGILGLDAYGAILNLLFPAANDPKTDRTVPAAD